MPSLPVMRVVLWSRNYADPFDIYEREDLANRMWFSAEFHSVAGGSDFSLTSPGSGQKQLRFSAETQYIVFPDSFNFWFPRRISG
jgi:hypothetical protein